MAGYTELMDELIASNPGLKSRFNKFVYFPDYNPDELYSIFVKMCSDNGYTINSDAKEYIKNQFVEIYNQRSENFANARGVRNFFEKAMTRQADRIICLVNPSNEELVELKKEDFC